LGFDAPPTKVKGKATGALPPHPRQGATPPLDPGRGPPSGTAHPWTPVGARRQVLLTPGPRSGLAVRYWARGRQRELFHKKSPMETQWGKSGSERPFKARGFSDALGYQKGGTQAFLGL